MIGAQLDCPQNFRMKAFSQAERRPRYGALLKFTFHRTYVKHSMKIFAKNLLITVEVPYFATF